MGEACWPFELDCSFSCVMLMLVAAMRGVQGRADTKVLLQLQERISAWLNCVASATARVSIPLDNV
jgi:hypothetical protein